MQDAIERNLSIKEFFVSRSGVTLDTLEDRTLLQCGIQNMDMIIIDEQAVYHDVIKQRVNMSSDPVLADSEARSCLSRLVSYNIAIANPLHLMALAAHSILLDANFVTQYETPNQVPGFAASIRGNLSSIP